MAQVVTHPVAPIDATVGTEPEVIPRAAHSVSRKDISQSALRVLYRLLDAGFESYLVGGGVRDLLLGLHPKDFDVATAARPEEVKALFRNSRLIGRRFRLAHVRFGREIVEVATFRAMHSAGADEEGRSEGRLDENGRIVRDNVYGTLEEDAWRRDFTVNCLYYDVRSFSLIDFTGGMRDLEARRLRLIGDPENRYREDPVRILRAIRLAAKLDFLVEPETEAPIARLADLLADIPPARLFEETLKLFLAGHAEQSFRLLERYDVFRQLFPQTARCFDDERCHRFVLQALHNTDARLREGKPVTPGFLFAALLWAPMRRLATELEASGLSPLEAMDAAGAEATVRQARRVAFPRRFSLMARDIWRMQPRLEQPRRGRRVLELVEHPRFRAAYDFLALRCEAGEESLQPVVEWWTGLQSRAPEAREDLLEGSAPARRRRPRRRRARRRAEA